MAVAGAEATAARAAGAVATYEGSHADSHCWTSEVVVSVAVQWVGLMVVGLVHEGWLDGSKDGGMAGNQTAGLICWV